jgi:cephalosporin hydroxylase
MREATPLLGFQFGRTFCDVCRSEIPLSAGRHHCFDCNADRCTVCREHDTSDEHPADHVGSWYPGLTGLGSAGRVAAGRSLMLEHERIRTELGGRPMGLAADMLPTILGGEVLKLNLSSEGTTVAARTFEALLTLRGMGRFVDFFARKSLGGSSVERATFVMSAGVRDANRWRGIPLFKSVFDCALYPILLASVGPATIFELGSALGGSAVWFADLTRMLGLQCHVYSMDLIPPDVSYPGVSFLKGNSHHLEDAFPPALLHAAPHPWIVVEDAHVNLDGVIEYCSQFMQQGDYMVIEDADAESAIGKYLLKHPRRYLVDTYYTDYFGYNATCSRDQILCFQGN